MLRFALVAYLNFTVALGPSLCCCSAHLLFPGMGEGGCCGSHKDELASHAEHGHHYHHGDVQDSHPQAAEVAEHSKPSPCDHNQEDCPCGRHQQTLLVSQSCDAATIRALETQDIVSWALVVDSLSSDSAGANLHLLLSKGHLRPGELSGREILRAYGVLRI
jgi:hypothetical protein